MRLDLAAYYSKYNDIQRTVLVQGIGGLCKVRGEYRVIIDRRLRAPERINILADALRRFDLSKIELGDALRRVLGQQPAASV